VNALCVAAKQSAAPETPPKVLRPLTVDEAIWRCLDKEEADGRLTAFNANSTKGLDPRLSQSQLQKSRTTALEAPEEERPVEEKSAATMESRWVEEKLCGFGSLEDDFNQPENAAMASLTPAKAKDATVLQESAVPSLEEILIRLDKEERPPEEPVEIREESREGGVGRAGCENRRRLLVELLSKWEEPQELEDPREEEMQRMWAELISAMDKQMATSTHIVVSRRQRAEAEAKRWEEDVADVVRRRDELWHATTIAMNDQKLVLAQKKFPLDQRTGGDGAEEGQQKHWTKTFVTAIRRSYEAVSERMLNRQQHDEAEASRRQQEDEDEQQCWLSGDLILRRFIEAGKRELVSRGSQEEGLGAIGRATTLDLKKLVKQEALAQKVRAKQLREGEEFWRKRMNGEGDAPVTGPQTVNASVDTDQSTEAHASDGAADVSQSPSEPQHPSFDWFDDVDVAQSDDASEGFQEQAALLVRDSLKLFGLQTSATVRDLRAAYRDLAMKYHPDKNIFQHKRDRQRSLDKFVLATESYKFLLEVLTEEAA